VKVLTRAVCRAEGDNFLRILWSRAGFIRAVPDAVAEVWLGAVAGDVALCASQLRAGDFDHITDANLL
jgi:hypothetical protein